MSKRIAWLSAVSVCVAGTAAAEPLSQKEIVALISGTSAKWQTVDGKIKGTIAWTADGAQTVTGNFPEFSADTGAWRVKGNKLCSKWTRIRAGAEKCETFELQNGTTYRSGNSLVTF